MDCMSPSDRFEPSQGLWISRVEKPAVALQAKSYPGLEFCHLYIHEYIYMSMYIYIYTYIVIDL